MNRIEDILNANEQQLTRVAFWYRHFNLLGPNYDRWVVHRNIRALFSVPYWILAWTGLKLQFWKSEAARRLAAVQFSKTYWRWYFASRACSFFTTRDIGPSQTGRLIISPRVHWLSALFLFQALDQPVIIPLSKSIRDQFRVHPITRVPNLGRLLDLVSIEDLPFEAQQHNIQTLIDRGYTVLVLIEDQETHPRLQPTLTMPEGLLAMIRSGVPTWMVDHSPFYQYQFATLWHPALVRIRVLNISELLDVSTQSNKTLASAISRWMGYDDFRVR